MEYILSVIVIFLIILAIIFYNVRVSFVKNNSKCFSEIIKFDNFNVNNYIVSLINNDKQFFINLINDITGNRHLCDKYLKKINKILYDTNFDYNNAVKGKLRRL